MIPKWTKGLIVTFTIIILVVACSKQAENPMETKIEQQELKKPADPPEGVECIDYDVNPQPVGGFISVQKNLNYPESARKAGIEGRVVVYANISRDGNVIDTKISESVSTDCDAAAINAIKAVQWKPALKKDHPLDVWVAIPIEFKLK